MKLDLNALKSAGINQEAINQLEMLITTHLKLKVTNSIQCSRGSKAITAKQSQDSISSNTCFSSCYNKHLLHLRRGSISSDGISDITDNIHGQTTTQTTPAVPTVTTQDIASQPSITPSTKLPLVESDFWMLEHCDKVKALAKHRQYGAKTLLDVFPIEDYVHVHNMLRRYLPDYTENYPNFADTDRNARQEQWARIPLNVIIDAFSRRVGFPFCESDLLASLNRAQTPQLPPLSHHLNK